MPQKWGTGILEQNREAGNERCGSIWEIGVALFCCRKLKLSLGSSFSPVMRNIWPSCIKSWHIHQWMSEKCSPPVSLWETAELRVKRAEVKARICPFLEHQEGTDHSEGRGAMTDCSRHWEIAKALPELMTCSVLPKDGMQAKLTPLHSRAYSPSLGHPFFWFFSASPLNSDISNVSDFFTYMPTYICLSRWPGGGFVSSKTVQWCFYLALTDIYKSKMMIVPPGNIGTQKPSPAKPFPLLASIDD